MAPQEKAKELIGKFMPHAYNPNPIFNTNWISEGHHARQIALITVEEVEKSLRLLALTDHVTTASKVKFERIWWRSVKEEIEKLDSAAKATEEKETQF